MTPFTRLTSPIAALMQANIDTDQILPANHMKGLTRAGLGRWLFEKLRYEADGTPRADFALNQPACRDARILVAGINFGCGSSREHAVWALADHGIRCIVAPSFGMIFESNCARNGLLLIRLPEAQTMRLANFAGQSATVDLDQSVILLPNGAQQPFSVDARVRQRLLSGEDEIGRTLAHAARIDAYEARAAG